MYLIEVLTALNSTSSPGLPTPMIFYNRFTPDTKLSIDTPECQVNKVSKI